MPLFHQIAAKAGTNLAETNKIIDAFTQVVLEDVARDQEVRLMGFSTWNLRPVAARRVKSICESHQITIPARKRVGFPVGAVLSQAAQPRKAKAASPPKAAPQKRYRGTPMAPLEYDESGVAECFPPD